MVNSVAPAYGDDGRATPPPLAGFPPKYTEAHYEEVWYYSTQFVCEIQLFNSLLTKLEPQPWYLSNDIIQELF